MIARKVHLGLQKSISVAIDTEGADYHKSLEKDVKKVLKQYELELLKKHEAFGLITYEYDADNLLEEWEDIIEDIETQLPQAKLQLFEGTYDELTDDFRYDYEDLQINI